MIWMKQQSRYENASYAVLWGLLFTAPLLSLFVRTMHDSNMSFDWQEVWLVWRLFGIYLVLFLIHNFILAPLLVYGRKRWLYAVLTACLLGAFTFYQCSTGPDRRPHGPRGPHAMEQRGERPPFMDNQRPPEFDLRPDGKFDKQPDGKFDKRLDRKFDKRFDEKFRGHRPPVFVGQHDVIAVVILILMFGMNLGVKLYFRSREDQKKLVELENQNLEQQLEYLKYQINPHFFMNTLNNIHALVDIDPQKAQETILELSKMMRFVLYEGDKKGVPLSREFEFIRTYINLMRLRYTDKVKISVELPDEVPDRTIPPLMLISFIENAFKHGISYQHESFIDIKVGVEHERLRFSCRNSKADKPNQEKGGVGLANVKQRLHLLYDNNFTLNIQDEADIYNIELSIPLKK
jgi:hypothetical protein